MQLTQAQKQLIRHAAFTATQEALAGIDTVTRGNVYNDAVEAAKAGTCEALLKYTHSNQSAAAELGGINRATLRVNIKRSNLL